MAEGLPSYEEKPIGIDMDEETTRCYAEIENFFSSRVSMFRSGSRKIMGSVIRLMTQYPDAPHIVRRIQDPDTGEVEFEPTGLDKSIRNKEEKLLEIIQEKIALGEKVLVYYNTVNTTDIGDHLTAYLCSEDIKAFELKASVKAEKRMDFINKEVKKGAQVMITNPSLVETGLDLLDFTTIIFFQVGYNLSTMRQASRRSWRLSQTKDIEVYFLYYNRTIQEQAIALMATKLQAAQTLEGNFSEEGLKAMSQNDDVLTQIANNVVNDIKTVVDLDAFKSARQVKQQANTTRSHNKTIEQIEYALDSRGQKIILQKFKKKEKQTKNTAYIRNDYTINPLKLFV
jgi:SNF2 family DNA or RNA helicase